MCLVCDWPNDNLPVSQTTQRGERLASHRQDTCLKLVISVVTTELTLLNRERNCIVAEVFLVVEENNNGKDSHKKSTKKKRQDEKPLLLG